MISENKIESGLSSIGAKRVDIIEKGDGSKLVDFHTDMPGEQPIRSSMHTLGDMIRKSTVRLGVLDERKFGEHPTNSEFWIQELKEVVRKADPPDKGKILVNYGDTNRKPRPHVLISWTPTNAEEIWTLQNEQGLMSFDDYINFVKRLQRVVKKEFMGGWG